MSRLRAGLFSCSSPFFLGGLERGRGSERQPLVPKKQQPYENQERRHARQGVLENQTHETRCEHFLMIGNGFDHKVGSIADICVGAKEDRADADGQKELVECRASKKKRQLVSFGEAWLRLRR